MINTHGYGYLTWTRIQGDERNPPISRHIDTTVDVTFNCVCVCITYTNICNGCYSQMGEKFNRISITISFFIKKYDIAYFILKILLRLMKT